jgi:anti-sigma B factor antagonist
VVAWDRERFDLLSLETFKSEMETIIKSHRRVVFDLEHLRFIDSQGLGVLLYCLRQLNGRGGDLKLCGVSSMMRMLFERTSMLRIFDIYPSRQDAVMATQWTCPWKSLDIIMSPNDEIRRKAMGGEVELNSV